MLQSSAAIQGQLAEADLFLRIAYNWAFSCSTDFGEQLGKQKVIE